VLDPNAHDRFVLRQRIKLAINQYEFTVPNPDGSESEPFCFVEQARFKFKEDIRFYADSSKQQELLRILARQRFDPRARYDVTDDVGAKIGEIQKEFGASLLRSTFSLYDGAGELVAQVREKSVGVALGRRAVNFIPVVENVADWLPIPYDFEFLAVAQDAHGRHVEARLLAHTREFRLELGTGFLYAGSQYRLVVGGDEFFLDLLFYHKRLRCWVVIDLGTGEFRPEYAGQMHFSPNVVDEQLRDAGGNFSYNDRACGGASRPDPGPPVCPPCHAMGHAVQSPCHTRGSQWPMPGSISCAVVWTC